MKPDAQILPHNLDAEQAFLGTFFLSEKAVDEIQGLLSPEDFYDPRHREIYRVILDLAERGHPIDPMLIINELGRQRLVEKVGGPAYVTGLEQSVISPKNIRYHAEIVKEKSLLRMVVSRTAKISDDASTENTDVSGIKRRIARLVSDLERQSSPSHATSAYESAREAYDSIVEDLENPRTGVLTGISELDNLTNGFQPGDLIVFASRPSVGKTSLGTQIASKAAGDGTGVVFFSLEMSGREVIERLTAQNAGVSFDRIRKRRLNDSDLHNIGEFLDAFGKQTFFIEDSTNVDDGTILSKATVLKAQYPEIGLIVVDYLQLIDATRGRGRAENRNLEIARISRGLKKMARSLNLPVIVLSQLSRDLEKTKRVPVLADLRDSGAIEQDADIVAFLHRIQRPNVGEDGNSTGLDHVELRIAKHRNGALGNIPLAFIQERTLFVQKEIVNQEPPHTPHWSG